MSKSQTDIYTDMKEKVIKSVGMIGSYIIIGVIMGFIYYQIYLASKDPKAFTKNFAYNIVTIVAPIIFILALIVFTSFEKDIRVYTLYGSLFIVGLVFLVFYFLKTSISKYIFNDYLLYFVIVLIVLFGLSIIFTIFSETLRKLNGWTGFFSNLLFYIPCLLRDFVKELINEYKSFSTTLMILFVFEIILILMYFFIIPLIHNKSFPEKTIILNDPVMINAEMDMCNSLKDSTGSNFSISMWIYLNSMPKSKKSYTEETTIFNYSNKSGTSPHIKITYLNNDRGSNNFIMYIGPEKFNISLPLQKWNNFVINYVTYDTPAPTPTTAPQPTPQPTPQPKPSTAPSPKPSTAPSPMPTPLPTPLPNPLTAPLPNPSSEENVQEQATKTHIGDIFINGVLERSYTFNSNEPPLFTNTDIMTIGDGKIGQNFQSDGLYGAICNIVYYKKPLSQLAIIYNYNLLSIKNPPIYT